MTAIDGTHARRYANYGRVAGVAIFVCAGALWAVPLPGMKQLPPKPVPATPPVPAEPAPTTVAAAKVDADTVDAMATRLDLAVVHAPPPPKPVAEDTKPKTDEPAGPEWTYLGPIHESARTLALISVDGHTKVLAEGRSFGDTKLVSAGADGIDVEVKGAPKHIARGERDPSKSVAWVRNLQNNQPAARVATVAGQPGAPGIPGGNLPPEVQRRLAERGFTPEQMQNWRGRGGGPNGRNRGTPGGFGGGGGGGGDARGPRGEAFQPIAVPVNVKPGTDAAVQIDALRRSAN